MLTVLALAQRSTSQELFRRSLALFTHPFMHRRELMAVFHRSFKWCCSLPSSRVARIPADIVDELLAAACMSPHAVGHLRWPIATELSCTDATPTAGGSVRATVQPPLAEALYRMTEHRGCHVRLDSRQQQHAEQLLPPDPLVAEVVACIPWQVGRSHEFPETAHINLQEMREIVWELRDRVNRTLQPARVVNGVDSMVCLGAWAKGRSSSFMLNGILRRSIGVQVLGRKSLANYHLVSADNPSDDPSRGQKLRAPKAAPSWLTPLLKPGPTESAPERGPPRARRLCLECHAGCGQLSKALERAGLLVARPFEAFP